MTTSFRQPQELRTQEITPHDASANFPAVIFYEDRLSGERAVEMCQLIARQFEAEFGLAVSAWRFDVLDIRALRDMAARELADARLVVFSSRSEYTPAPQLRRWLETNLPAKQERECALAALVICSPEQSDQTSSGNEYVRALARRTKQAFFPIIYCLEAATAPQPRFTFSAPSTRAAGLA